MDTTTYTLVVHQSNIGSLFAGRWLKDYDRDDGDDLQRELGSSRNRRLITKFQQEVMDIFEEVIMTYTHEKDDLLEDTDQDVVDVYRLYREFHEMYPKHDVLTIIPVNLSGTFGWVVQPKDMKPKTHRGKPC